MAKVLLHLLILLGSFLGMWLGFTQVDWITLFKIESVSEKTEDKLGNLLWESIKASEEEITDKRVTRPVDSILQRLCTANGFDRKEVKLHVIKKDEVNAFAFPGKRLVVYSGLINDSKKEAELAGVMAHELAHIKRNHVMKKLIKEVGLTALISIAAGGGGEMIGELVRTLSSSAYDRSLESEADMYAVDYLMEAKVDPTPFADFLARLARQEPEAMKHFSWISTHPDTQERADKIYERANDSGWEYEPILSDETWKRLKSEVMDTEYF
jgi:predicted Zn-dependent protease